jgi:hypothetical protein
MNFVKGASALKVKEVPGYVQKYAGENLTPTKVESWFSKWSSGYRQKVGSCVRLPSEIDTLQSLSSVDPSLLFSSPSSSHPSPPSPSSSSSCAVF